MGRARAKEYCLCIVKILSKKFNNTEIDELFKKKPEDTIKGIEFASTDCEKNKKAF